ncbi:MAG: type IV pilus twitching motility protein PilT [Tissierellales bacterium]|jgi:twitching motility protein PilT|nr:type IV pilus twitching motility protein PilT [Tissierellales bacterium]
MTLDELLKKTVELGASDLHITVGYPPVIRLNGALEVMDEYPKLMPDVNEKLVREATDEHTFKILSEVGELDSSISIKGLGRFRLNVYKQRGTYGMAIRAVGSKIPTIDELGLPERLKEFAREHRGLVLVTGPTGSGKSTTLAAMIDQINHERKCHILTLEDPIEYLHRHNMSMVNQREIGHDSRSFANALRASLRQDPDVILVGEMRDLETISIAMTAAETGHLVFSTLHTVGAAKTIDRIIDVFPPHQQQQIRVQLGSVLRGVVSQQLLPRKDGNGRVAAVEIMAVNSAVQNLIREGKTHQIQTVIQTGMKQGMIAMDACLVEHYKKGLISKESLLEAAINRDTILRYL